MKLNDTDAFTIYLILVDEQQRIVNEVNRLDDNGVSLLVKETTRKDLISTFNMLSNVRRSILNSQEIAFDGSFTKQVIEDEIHINDFQQRENL
jgi:hypothetical protein